MEIQTRFYVVNDLQVAVVVHRSYKPGGEALIPSYNRPTSKLTLTQLQYIFLFF